jgi:GTP pyrophosphokinase
MPQQVIDYLGLEPSDANVERAVAGQKESANLKSKKTIRENKDIVLLLNGDSAMISLANCCTPIPGDDIVGYVTKGRGIKVHRANCPNIVGEEARLVGVKWNENQPPEAKYPVDFAIDCFDRSGLLVDIMNTVTAQGASVTNISAKYKASHGTSTINCTVMIKDKAALDKLFSALQLIKSVYSIRRALH